MSATTIRFSAATPSRPTYRTLAAIGCSAMSATTIRFSAVTPSRPTYRTLAAIGCSAMSATTIRFSAVVYLLAALGFSTTSITRLGLDATALRTTTYPPGAPGIAPRSTIRC